MTSTSLVMSHPRPMLVRATSEVNQQRDGGDKGTAMKMTKDDWVTATTCVGSAMIFNGGHLGMAITSVAQRLTDEQWNEAADMSEGMLARTDEKTEE